MASAVILIGIPASGKSTLAQQMLRAHSGLYAYVSPDRVREELYGCMTIQGEWTAIWAKVIRSIEQAKALGQDLIYDATNYKRKYRREVIQVLREEGFHQITGIYLPTPLWICLNRNQLRPRQVPEDVIMDMHRCLVLNPPQLSDGFDRLFLQEERPESEWMD